MQHTKAQTWPLCLKFKFPVIHPALLTLYRTVVLLTTAPYSILAVVEEVLSRHHNQGALRARACQLDSKVTVEHLELAPADPGPGLWPLWLTRSLRLPQTHCYADVALAPASSISAPPKEWGLCEGSHDHAKINHADC